MTFDEAKRFAMPFGKHQGRTLDEVSRTDDGLQYLDWLRGAREAARPGRATDVDDALAAFLGDPTIARELDGALEECDPEGSD